MRVKRKGQITIPAELRSKLGIEEGAILEIRTSNDEILLKPLQPLVMGKPVGEVEHKKILKELETLRGRWR